MTNNVRVAQAAPTLAETQRLIQVAVYVQGLRTFDWFYAFSDSDDVARRGEAQLGLLRAQQRLLDPTGEIWRMVAPRGHGVPGPVVRDSVRGTLPLNGIEDPDDGRVEYAVSWWHGDVDEPPNELTIWAHTGTDAMLWVYEHFGLNITVEVKRVM